MAFSQATISDGPTVTVHGADVLVAWSSTAPAGTAFQLYGNGRLLWSGTARRVILPYPHERTLYRVGTVDAGETQTDLSGTLPAVSGDGGAARVKLTWQGGTYLDTSGRDDIDGFHIYGESTPGGGIDYGTVLATIPAYSRGQFTDGWGMGGWGQGGWGRAASSYRWTSPPLAGGTWAFAIKPFGRSGNEGTAMTTSLAVSAPPRPPAADADGVRLRAMYDPATAKATLTWAASP